MPHPSGIAYDRDPVSGVVAAVDRVRPPTWGLIDHNVQLCAVLSALRSGVILAFLAKGCGHGLHPKIVFKTSVSNFER